MGLKSHAGEGTDPGRYKQTKIPAMRGAFKTPTLRDVSLTAPYFHDGSAATLEEVIAHYAVGGVVRTNLSPHMRPLALTLDERDALAAFLRSLTTEHPTFRYPVLPD